MDQGDTWDNDGVANSPDERRELRGTPGRTCWDNDRPES